MEELLLRDSIYDKRSICTALKFRAHKIYVVHIPAVAMTMRKGSFDRHTLSIYRWIDLIKQGENDGHSNLNNNSDSNWIRYIQIH